MLTNLGAFLPLLNLILVIGLAIGGAIAIRSGVGKETSGMQDRAIDAQTAQIAAQTAQIGALEQKIERLERMLETVQEVILRRGLRVEINGEYVTLIDEGNKRQSTVKIRVEPEPSKKEEDN
jgi:hypothetical protein